MEFNKKLLMLQKRYNLYLKISDLTNNKELTFNDYCTLWLIDPTQCVVTEEEELEKEVLDFQND